MGKKLLPALQVKQMIERMVKSGAVPDEKAAEWKEKIENEEAVAEMRRKAEGGDGTAALQLAECYYYGLKGLAIDKTTGARFYKQVAKAGDARGMGRLASLYFYGSGVGKNLALALRWASAAVALDNGSGHRILSKFYLDGLHGIPKDEEEGFRMYATGCEKGFASAKGWVRLAGLYEHGTGTPIDMDKAAECMRKAVRNGSPAGSVETARAWLSAQGLEVEP
jgi:TPR repeat protein